MKILVVGDLEARALWDYFDPARVKGVEMIISTGDLNPRYLEFLVTLVNCPLLYVHGNHDERYENDPPEGCVCIEDTVVRYRGLRIFGLGGSMRYKKGPFMYTEFEMRLRAFKGRIKAFLSGGVDILVTHAPARGYGDMDDLPHRGFQCFNKFLEKVRPQYMVYGHVHKNYGSFKRERIHECGTRLVNAYEYCFLEIELQE